jgi:outer membrane protein assembly factor BamB
MLRRVLFLAAVIAIAPGCSTVKGWFGGHSKSKGPQPAELTAIATPIAVSQLWSVNLGDGEGRRWLRQHPTIANGRVYATDDKGNLVALDAATGKEIWAANAVTMAATRSKLVFWKKHDAIEAGLTGSPGVGNGLVVVGGRNGEVVAFGEDGTRKWSVKVSSEVLSAPLVDATRVVVRSNDGRVFGLDPADGSRKWVYDRGLPTLSVRGNATPVGANGTVYIGYDDGTLVALREEDGQRAWEQIVAEPEGRTELARMADIDGEIFLDGDQLFVVSYHDKVMALSATSGQPLWQHDVGGWSGAALTADKLLLTDQTGNVWALNRETGDSLWKQNLLENRQLTTPVIQGDYAVVGDLEGYLHWFRLETGDLVGRTRVEHAALRGTPQISPDGTLYALSNEGELAAYRLGN